MKINCSGNHIFRGIIGCLLIFLFNSNSGFAQSKKVQTPQDVPEEAASIINVSTELLEHFVSEIGTGKSIPPGILVDCAAVLAIPAPTTFADTDVPRQNKGVILSRDQDQWSLPVFTSISSTTLGARLAIQTKDIVLIFRERETISRLLDDGNLEFGVDLTVSEGPAGGIADLSTIDAEVLVYRRTRGAYVGILAFAGGDLAIEPNMTVAYYTEPSQGPVHGYYSDNGEKLVQDLLRHEQRFGIQAIPTGALKLKLTMERLAGSR